MSENANPPNPEQPATWELLNDEMRHRLDVQRAAGERIDAKAAIVLGAAIAAVQFVAKEPVRSYWLPASVSAYAVAIVLALVALRPRAFDEVGGHAMLVGLWAYPRGRAAAELANNRVWALTKNAERQTGRIRWLWASIAVLLLAAMMSVVHLTQGERIDAGPTARICSAGSANPCPAP
ncbi:MAG: hypothetical protein QOH79_130 [Acidimicrobiaceae bacterium]